MGGFSESTLKATDGSGTIVYKDKRSAEFSKELYDSIHRDIDLPNKALITSQVQKLAKAI
jgi:hypothetical protein